MKNGGKNKSVAFIILFSMCIRATTTTTTIYIYIYITDILIHKELI